MAHVSAAVDAWGATGVGPKLRVVLGAGGSLAVDGRNTLSIGSLADVPGHADSLGVTIWHDEGAVRQEADVRLSDSKPWALLDVGPEELPVACDGAYDLQSVVTHELGHFLGIQQEDRENEGATMYESTRLCSVRKRTLEQSDVDALAELYTR